MKFLKKIFFASAVIFLIVIEINFSSCTINGKPAVSIEIGKTPLSDSVNFRGAEDISVVGRELFRCFKGEKNQGYLQHLFPDSIAVTQMYSMSKANPKTETEIDSLCSEARKQVSETFKQAQQGGLMENVVWANATIEKMMTQDIDVKSPPSKMLFIYGKSGEVKFKISAMCMLLDKHWFIGQEIKFKKY